MKSWKRLQNIPSSIFSCMPNGSYDKIVDVATVLFAHFSKSQSSIDHRTSINIIKHQSHYTVHITIDIFSIFQSFGTYTHWIRSESKIKFLLSTRGSPILPYQTRWLPTPTLSRLDHNSIFGPLNVSHPDHLALVSEASDSFQSKRRSACTLFAGFNLQTGLFMPATRPLGPVAAN